jgi:hypothetical protein
MTTRFYFREFDVDPEDDHLPSYEVRVADWTPFRRRRKCRLSDSLFLRMIPPAGGGREQCNGGALF